MNLRALRNSLGYKVSVGFSLVALILIGTILYTLIQIHTIMRQAEVISTHLNTVVDSSINLRNKLNNMIGAERDWLITGQNIYQLQRKQMWINDVLPVSNNLILNADFPDNAYGEKDIVRITDNIQKLNTIAMATEAIPNIDDARAYFYQYAAPLFLKTRTQLSSFIDQQRHLSDEHLQNMHDQMRTAYIVNLSLLIIGAILCILMGFLLTRTMTRPISRLVAIANELARGNLDQHVAISGSTEFEVLSQSLNRVIQTLQEVEAVTGSMAEGDYSHRVQIKSDKDRLGIAVNAMLDDFNQIVESANAIAEGDFRSDIKSRSAIDTLGKALSNMTHTLRKNHAEVEQQNWLKDGLAEFATMLSEAHDLKHLCQSAISVIARYSQAGTAALYLFDKEHRRLNAMGTYALVEKHSLPHSYALGEGIVGQVAAEQKPISLAETQEQQCFIATGVEEVQAQTIYAFPLIYERSLVGVCVIAWSHKPHHLTQSYLDSLTPLLAGHVQAAEQQAITEQLLGEQKLSADQLRIQQEELKVTNEELEEQTQILKASEEELRLRDEQQQKINKQLEDRTHELEQQKSKIESTNYALQLASAELKLKAEALTKASQYKSEFLANMSHELRTPLNSLLILAKILSDNQENNLNAEQIESAKIIFNSGQDLLTLINDILDLAKVEAGKVEINKNNFSISELVKTLHDTFTTIAETKNVKFTTEISQDVPQSLYSDQQRILQILRNLCANSVKFTERGEVKLRLYVAKRRADMAASASNTPWLAFEVSDTGIGIPKDKQNLVFEAFQQADGTTSRKYGGTGLGLSISREFSRLLGGRISLQSEVGVGSTFTLLIPLLENYEKQTGQAATVTEPVNTVVEPNVKKKSIKKLLVIEDDVSFAEVIMKISRQRGYQCKHLNNATQALTIAESDQPDAILLDIGLPGMDGLTFLDHLKNNPKTKHIPVQIISATDKGGDAIKRGAIGYLAKPITKEQLDRALDSIMLYDKREIKNLLLIEDDKNLLTTMSMLFAKKEGIIITTATTGAEAIAILQERHIDCIILDLGLPDMTGIELLQQLYQFSKAPAPYPAIIIFTGKELKEEETEQLNQLVDSIVIKGSTASIDRLVEETDWFLQHTDEQITGVKPAINTVSPSPVGKIKTATKSTTSALFQGQSILLVDDDKRGSFALTQMLKQLGLKVTSVNTAESAINTLKQNHFDLIFMDIMMPSMDGYTAIHTIKKEETLKPIPIIALTAKAMADDMQKCLDAGADDYVAKPIDTVLLTGKLQKWLNPP